MTLSVVIRPRVVSVSVLEVAYFACFPILRIVTTLACVIPATLGDRFGTLLTPNLGPDDLKPVYIPPPLPFGGQKVARAPTVWRGGGAGGGKRHYRILDQPGT